MPESAADGSQSMIAAAAKRLVAEITAQASQAINDKTVFVDAVTKERATWRAELRTAAASLIARLRVSGAGTALDFMEAQRLRAEIILRLNPAGRSDDQAVRDAHPHDRDLHKILDELWADSGVPGEDYTALATRLERSVQELLKQEWSVSKREAVTGEIAGGDSLQPVPGGST